MRTFVAVLALLALLLGGCRSLSYTDGPPTLGGLYGKHLTIAYDGPMRPIDEVGVITTDGIVRIVEIDGKDVSKAFRNFKTPSFYPGGRFQTHLLPGTYQLTLQFHYDIGTGVRKWSASNVQKTVRLDKGQILHLSWIDHGREWDVRQSDGSAARAAVVADYQAFLEKEQR